MAQKHENPHMAGFFEGTYPSKGSRIGPGLSGTAAGADSLRGQRHSLSVPGLYPKYGVWSMVIRLRCWANEVEGASHHRHGHGKSCDGNGEHRRSNGDLHDSFHHFPFMYRFISVSASCILASMTASRRWAR